MEIILLRFHTCNITTTPILMSSGMPYGYVRKVVLRKQYTTRQSIIAIGSTFPRYTTFSGSVDVFLNIRNGNALVKKVVIATTRIIARLSFTPIMMHPPYLDQHVFQISQAIKPKGSMPEVKNFLIQISTH